MLTSRPRTALLVVLVFVIVAGVVGGPLAGRLSSDGGFVAPGADSEVAVERISAATGRDAGAGIVLLTTPAARDGAATRVRQVPGVADVATPGPRVVAATLRAGADAHAAAEAALDAFRDRRDVTVGGPAVADLQVSARVSGDLGRAELLAFPLLILLSLLFFRGRAALLPLVVGVTTVLGTFLALSAVNEIYQLNVYALNLVIGLGLGLAIDYTLFLVTRLREEVAAGTSDAAATTIRTVGRTIGFSAATVAAALITLTIFPQAFLKSMGIAGAVVAVVAGAAALAICAPAFTLWGAGLARTSAPARRAETRWHRLAHAVMRRPGLVALVTAAAMLAVAVPSLDTHWSAIDSTVIPKGESSRTVADALDGS